jgi:hypothetical protein
MMSYSNLIKYSFFSTLSLFFISCSGPEKLDLSNIESEVITFYENETEENNFPSMMISTNGQQIVDEPKINANLAVIENKNETNYKIGIEIRGSSSQMFPKKSYGFETRNSDWSEDIDVNLGGFPEEEDWILYGPYSDKSLIRNKLTFDLSNSIGYKASKVKFYNLYINNDYKGLYVLMEKIKRDENRVDITKLEGDSVEGGYILKIDKPTSDTGACNSCIDYYYDSPFSFRSQYDTNGNFSSGSSVFFISHYPKPEDITIDQKNYISSIINEFESILSSDNFDDPETGYQSVIDIDSFIDFFIMNEITKNIDGYRISTFINVDIDKKIKMGPIWDFNLAFGNADYCDGANTQGWMYNFNTICPGDSFQVPFWWRRLMESEYFKEKLKDKWQLFRTTTLSNVSIESQIDSYVEYLNTNNVVAENFNKWPILSKYVWPNYFIGATHESEINYLKGWINQRLNWMDGQINNF